MNVLATAFAVLLAQPAPAASGLLVPQVAQVTEQNPPLAWDGVGADARLTPMMNAVLALEDDQLAARIELIVINARSCCGSISSLMK